MKQLTHMSGCKGAGYFSASSLQSPYFKGYSQTPTLYPQMHQQTLGITWVGGIVPCGKPEASPPAPPAKGTINTGSNFDHFLHKPLEIKYLKACR
ncbi:MULTISPECIES: hypothetical protein [Pseudomonas syringae group]|uniref:hypothetical protein n=1 Tax=Pseudomonas syringae group TaxID=136849 RepID=UPI0012B8050B|nr:MULTISPECIES: hypothetical protein [Pseudomonas syringae group]